MDTGAVLMIMLGGSAAGVAATWIMTAVTTFLYEREETAAREREDRVRGDMTAYEIAADRGAGLVGRELTKAQRGRIGNAIHWGLGIAAAVVYAFFRSGIDDANIIHGLLFGLVFWAVMDELLVPLLRLTPGPLAFPWQTHFRGLAGHLVFGAVTELTLAATAVMLSA